MTGGWRAGLVFLVVLALAPSGLARAAEAHRPVRIYVALWNGWNDVVQGFKAYLAENGIGADLIVRDAGGERERLADFAAEAQVLRPDLVLTVGDMASRAILEGEGGRALRAAGIPAVFAMVSPPVARALSVGAAAQGVTGITDVAPLDAQMDLLLSYRPFHALGMVYDPTDPDIGALIEALAREGRGRGFSLTALPVDEVEGAPSPASIADRIAALRAAGVDVLYIPAQPFLQDNRKDLTGAALAAGVPSFAAGEAPLVDGQALFGAVYRAHAVGRMVGWRVAAILRDGRKPETMPIEGLAHPAVLIDMAVARALRLYPPLSLLRRADILDPAPTD